MLGFERRTLPVSLKSGGCSSVPWKVCCLLTVRSTPSKPWMKSMCHQSRRNSPSVTDWMPTDSCSFTTSRMSLSWISLSFASDSSPLRFFARPSCRSWGRSRLPTWSARNGGFMVPPTEWLRRLFQRERLVGGFPREVAVLAAEVAVRGGLLVNGTQEIQHLDDAARPQIEVLRDQRRERVVGH